VTGEVFLVQGFSFVLLLGTRTSWTIVDVEGKAATLRVELTTVLALNLQGPLRNRGFRVTKSESVC